MTTIVTRAGKGSPLTWNEVDTNFTNLNSAKYESGNNVSFGTIGGSTITASSGFSGALNGTVGATTPASGSFTSLTDSGNLTFTGTGNRITGDFSNATVANRVLFQTSTTNGNTNVAAIPNGTSTTAALQVLNNSDPTNAALGNFVISSTELAINSAISGTGTYLPMLFSTGGSERMRIDTSGKLGLGVSSINSNFIAQFNGNIGLGSPTRNQATTASIGVRTSNDPADDQRSQIVFGTTAGASSSDSYITFNTNQYGVSAGERMRIDSAGNVGIGTSSPSSFGKLTVMQTSGSTSLQINTTTNGAGMYWASTNSALVSQYSYGGTLSIGTTDSNAFNFLTNNTERMRIHASGGVSIGNTTDRGAGNLNVSGTINGGYVAHATGTTAMAFGSYKVVRVTPNATATYTTTVPPAGATCTLSILTSGTTSYTITFGTGFKTTGTLATGTVSARYFQISFVSDGTNLLETARTVAIA